MASVPVRRFLKQVFISVHFALRPVRLYILAIFWYFLGSTRYCHKTKARWRSSKHQIFVKYQISHSYFHFWQWKFWLKIVAQNSKSKFCIGYPGQNSKTKKLWPLAKIYSWKWYFGKQMNGPIVNFPTNVSFLLRSYGLQWSPNIVLIWGNYHQTFPENEVPCSIFKEYAILK